MRKQRFHILTLLLITLMLMLAACGKDEPDNKPESTSTPAPSVAPTNKPDELTPTIAPSATAAPTEAPTEDELPSATPEPEITESEQPTPTPAGNATPTEIPPTPTPTLRDTTSERDEYWELTYLIWIPKFTDGVFDSKSADDTFDYAVFTDVESKDVTNYINTLKANGFSNVKTNNASGNLIEYAATNEDDWSVRLVYKNGTLTIGSGFVDDEAPSSEEEARNNAWSSTSLQYLPEFTAGSFESTSVETDDLVFNYAFFSGVSEDDARNYVEKLKDAGYIYGPDEGDSDGIIWYMAINEDRLNCYVAYDNDLIKIGCGYEE